MRSRPPSSACSTDSAFSAHQRAASAPCSTVRSAPSTPGCTSTPSWLRGQLPRRASAAAVHDDRVERIVRRVRPGQRRCPARRAGRRSCSQPPLQEVGRRAPCHGDRRRTRRARARRRARRARAYTCRSGATVSRAGVDREDRCRRCRSRRAAARGAISDATSRCSIAPSWPGQDLRAAHVPRDACARRATTTGSRTTTATRTRSSIAARNSVHVAPYERPAAPMRAGIDERVRARARRARAAGPRGCARAARRRPSWRTRDPSRSGTCRRASSRRAHRSRAGRARARRSPRDASCVRVGVAFVVPPRSSTPQMRALPGPCPWIASTAGPGSRRGRAARAGTRAPTSSPRCRTRRARARYVAAVDGLGRLEVERHRLGRGPEHREHAARARARATARARVARSSSGHGSASTAASCCSRQYAQFEKFRGGSRGVVTRRRRAPSRGRPTRCRRYAGVSHAHGKCPRLVENTRPSPSVKHHASG